MNQFAVKIFSWLFRLILLTPLIYWQKFWFPFVTTKTLYFQSLIELAFPFYLYLIIQNKEFRPNLKNPLSLTILGFFAINLISALFGLNFIQSFFGTFKRMSGVFNLGHLVLFYFYILTLAKIDRDFIDRLLKIIVWVSGTAAFYAVWVAIGLPKFFAEPYAGRASSFFGNPIFFASFLIVPMFLAALLALREEDRRRKYTYWVLVIVHLLGIYVSVTRGAVVGLAVGLFMGVVIYVFFVQSRRIKLYAALFVIVLMLAADLIFVLGSKSSNDSIVARFTKVSDNDSKARLIQWGIALEGFKERPVLGTGPENYYVIPDKYFQPELYNYDSSWWDKPHNYLLEILTTTGVIGLLMYLAVLFFAGKAIFNAYKEKNINLVEIGLLFAALVAYQIQNLFVFDTISASLMFFAFIGFLSLLGAEKDLQPVRSAYKFSAQLAFGASAVAVVCLLYVSNWSHMRIMYNLNKATVREVRDPALVKNYYDKSAALPFNYDLAQVALDYEEFAVAAVSDDKIDRQFAQESVDDAIRVWERVVAKEKPHPSYYWLKLGNLYYIKVSSFDTDDLAKAGEALKQAEKVAPGRFEHMQTLAKIRIEQNKIVEAEQLLDKMLAIVPQNTNSHWHYNRRQDVLSVIYTLVKYYSEQENHNALIALQTKAINRIEPDNYILYANLAESYAAVGDKQKAIEAARKVIELNPAERANAEAFIESLN